MIATPNTTDVQPRPFPTNAKVVVNGKSGVVVRDDNLDKRYVKFDRPGSMERNPRWIPLAELSRLDDRYTPVQDPEPEVEVITTAAVPVPPRPEPLPALPEADPDADTQPVEEAPAMPQPLGELQQLREQVARLEQERDEAKSLVSEANEALREAVGSMTRLKRDRDELAKTNDALAAQVTAGIFPPAAPKPTRIETTRLYNIDDGRLADMLNDGWRVVYEQMCAYVDTFTDGIGRIQNEYVIRFEREVQIPATPPQPSARASVAAVLTADFVRESLRDIDTEIDEDAEPVLPHAERGERGGTLHLNKQPDSPARTEALYYSRKRTIGQKKAGGFIARQNTIRKHRQGRLVQALADAGLPIAATLVEHGIDDTKAVLNQKIGRIYIDAYNAAMQNIVTVPLLSHPSL